MKSRKAQVGFSQRVRLEWFEKTASLVLAGNDKDNIYKALQNMLKDRVSVAGNSSRGNREKVITILMKTWFNVPPGLEDFRDEGLQFLKKLPKEERLPIHWGMILAAYSFWGDVAAATGRLIKLQGMVAAAHVQRRLREQYGERETAARAARRVLRSFIDWGVLKETGTKGVYAQGVHYAIQDPSLLGWVLEGTLRAQASDSAAFNEILESPSLFAFQKKYASPDQIVINALRVELLRHNMAEYMLILK